MSFIINPFVFSSAAVLPSDDFNRADHATLLGTSSSGHAWNQNGGAWGISSNKAYLPDVSGLSPATLESGLSDCTVQVAIDDSGGSLGTRLQLVFRYTDDDNYLFLYFISSNTFRCYKRVAASNTQLYTQSVTMAKGDVLKVVLLGDQIGLYHNGDLKTTLTESHNQSATQHGIGWQTGGSSSSTARWDDFSVTA